MTSPAKPSKPSRAYFQLSKQDYIRALSDKVRETTFVDAKASVNDPALLGPPSVEFAPYGRVPHNKPRKDARQGTIDQDPEFITFLESLTNPIPKSVPSEIPADVDNKKGEDKAVTPLIQFLRDKKANKIKDPTVVVKNTKHSRQDSKDNKTGHGFEKKTSVKSEKPTPTTPTVVDKRSANAIRVEKIARDAARSATEQVKNMSRVASSQMTAYPAVAKPASETTSQPVSPAPAPNPAPAPERKRERGNASGVARILQRDLGLGGNPAGRRRREGPTNSAAVASGSSAKQDSAAVPPSKPLPSKHIASSTATNALSPSPLSENPNPMVTVPATTSHTPPTGPASTRPNFNHRSHPPTKPVIAPVTKPPVQSKQTAPAPTSTQAFLKHANPSQGITEPLLQAAFTPFGDLVSVTIDTKKGFAYMDFATPEGLQKAMAASPVKVAQGQVVVLERKVGGSSAGALRGGRGGAPPGRGGQTPMRGGRGGSVRGTRGPGRGSVAPIATKPTDATGGATAPTQEANSAATEVAHQPPAASASSADGALDSSAA